MKGEDALICAARELREETGIDAGTLTNIGRFVSHNTIYETFLYVTDCDKNSITRLIWRYKTIIKILFICHGTTLISPEIPRKTT